MQDLAGGDYIRTPVIFWGLDNLVFVGVIGNVKLETYARSLQSKSSVILYHILWCEFSAD